jgi:2-keto-3-deoxy-L-rhamnonate aldolase RhmA
MRIETSIADSFRLRLSGNEPTYMLAIRAWASTELIHLAHNTGHHAVYFDFQHGAFGLTTAAPLILTANALGMPALVRLPKLEISAIATVLDSGATGVILPDVETAAQALQAISAAHLPPKGNRSYGGVRGFHQELNPMVIVMIESLDGVNSSDAIAAVKGLDALMVGSQDLSASLQSSNADCTLNEAIQEVIDSGKNHGVPVIIGGMREPSRAAELVRCGASPCFSVGTDIGYTLQGAKLQISAFEQVFR